jgi:hypothetical protein
MADGDVQLKPNRKGLKRESSFNRVKYISIIVFIASIIFASEYRKMGGEFLGIPLGYWIAGGVVSHLLAYLLHVQMFFKTLKVYYLFPKFQMITLTLKRIDFTPLSLLLRSIFPFHLGDDNNLDIDSYGDFFIRVLKRISLMAVSPDYLYATTFKTILNDDRLNRRCPHYHGPLIRVGKQRCEKSKEESTLYDCELQSRKDRRKHFIVFSNWANVVITIIFVIIVLLVRENRILQFLFAILLFRVLSRTVEIVIAFYQDSVRTKMDRQTLNMGYKASSLKRGHRISLALHSYFELSILFALIYKMSDKFHYFKNSGYMDSFLDYVLYSFSVSAYNFSFDMGFTTFQKLIHVSQVFSSIVLVALSISSYIGLSDSMTETEKKIWRQNKRGM